MREARRGAQHGHWRVDLRAIHAAEGEPVSEVRFDSKFVVDSPVTEAYTSGPSHGISSGDCGRARRSGSQHLSPRLPPSSEIRRRQIALRESRRLR
jgi:hypothetical protein